MKTLMERDEKLEARGRSRRAGRTASRLTVAWKQAWHKKASEIAMFGL